MEKGRTFLSLFSSLSSAHGPNEDRSSDSLLADSQTLTCTMLSKCCEKLCRVTLALCVCTISYLGRRRVSGSVSSFEVALRTDHDRWHWIPDLKSSSLPVWTVGGLMGTQENRERSTEERFMKELKLKLKYLKNHHFDLLRTRWDGCKAPKEEQCRSE